MARPVPAPRRRRLVGMLHQGQHRHLIGPAQKGHGPAHGLVALPAAVPRQQDPPGRPRQPRPVVRHHQAGNPRLQQDGVDVAAEIPRGGIVRPGAAQQQQVMVARLLADHLDGVPFPLQPAEFPPEPFRHRPAGIPDLVRGPERPPLGFARGSRRPCTSRRA